MTSQTQQVPFSQPINLAHPCRAVGKQPFPGKTQSKQPWLSCMPSLRASTQVTLKTLTTWTDVSFCPGAPESPEPLWLAAVVTGPRDRHSQSKVVRAISRALFCLIYLGVCSVSRLPENRRRHPGTPLLSSRGCCVCKRGN